MAKGNLGNLLQHFVTLRAVEGLLSAWNRPRDPVLYVDCYSMAPWEKITGKRPEGFDSIVQRFAARSGAGDLVASSFLSAWRQYYTPSQPPQNIRDRMYPNTAVLLRTAFPAQTWEMRLHDIVSQHRIDLTAWAGPQTPKWCEIEDNWEKSPLVCNRPAPVDRPVILLLDPYRVVAAGKRKGFLTGPMLDDLLGGQKLNLKSRPSASAPVLAAIFSYSDPRPDESAKIIRDRFDSDWCVEEVRTSRQRTGTQYTWHLGCVATRGLPSPVLGGALQDVWDQWAG